MEENKDIDVEIILPLYNAAFYIKELILSIRNQKGININKLHILLTKSEDTTKKILDDMNEKYEQIEKANFNHALTREKALFSCNTKVAIMLTQDVVFKDNFVLSKLAKDIIDGFPYTFARQVSLSKDLDKYYRKINYVDHDIINQAGDIEAKQIKAFFASDVCAAYDAYVFKKINGYDNKKQVTNEDMYYAHKLLVSGYKYKYNSKAILFHSHQMKIKDVKKRYYNIGCFFKDNPEFSKYKKHESAFKLAKKITLMCLKDFNLKALFMFPIDAINKKKYMNKGIKGESYESK